MIIPMANSPATSFFSTNTSPRGDYGSSPLLKKRRKSSPTSAVAKQLTQLYYRRPALLICLSLLVFASIVLCLKRFSGAKPTTADLLASDLNIENSRTEKLSAAAGGRSLVDPSTYMTQLSWSPRIFQFKNFLTPEECDRIIEMAKKRLKSSTLYAGSGNFEDDKTRSSQDMFFDPSETAWIDERIARATRIPASHGESLTVIHYGPTQQYLPHFDYFAPNQDASTDQLLETYGNRIATFIMYLNDLPEGAGGETKFPRSNTAIRPKRGDAAFFYNLLPDGTPDPMSLHTGSPVIHGEKWIATKWMREKKWQYTEDYVPTFGTPAKDVDKKNPVNAGYVPTFGTAAKDIPKEQQVPKQ